MASETRSWPYSRLFHGPSKIILVTGPHILVFSSKTGEIVHSTTQLSEDDQKNVVKSGPIQCVAVDQSFKYIAEVGDDKLLKVWDIEESGGLKLVNSRELPKKPTGVLFTKDSQTILVSDKFGDVFSYPLVYVPFTDAEIEQQKIDEAKDPYASHINPSNGTLILGHASPLNAMLLTHSDENDEKYIVTADRDEHIRVSWYPQGYNVENYCLGHRKFVSALHISSYDPSILVSGGGDPVLKVWDWMTGEQKGDIAVSEAVEPFMAVERSPGKGRWDNEGGENEGEEGGSRKNRKKKGKGKNKSTKETSEAAEEGVSMAVDEDLIAKSGEPADSPEKVLAIRRIASVLDQGGKLIYLFSAIGATALFWFPSQETWEGQSSSAVSLSHFDFGKPIVDFVVIPPSSSKPSLVFVLLDPSYQETTSTPGDRVRLLAASAGGLSEPWEEISALHTLLLAALNHPCTAIPASDADLKGFDLYSELVSLPKIVTRGPDLDSTKENNGPATPLDNTGSIGGLTKRELGRMKRTARVKEVKTKVLGGEQEDKMAGNGDTDSQPQLKRSKSESSEVS